MQPGAVLFLHLLCRNNSAAKVCKLQKLALNRLQPFTSLPMSDLTLGSIPAEPPKLLIQLLNLGDLRSETRNLVAKNP